MPNNLEIGVAKKCCGGACKTQEIVEPPEEVMREIFASLPESVLRLYAEGARAELERRASADTK